MIDEKLEGFIEKQIDFDNVVIEFKRNKRGNLKISIQGLGKSCRNPILAWALHSSIFARISSQMAKDTIESLYKLREKAKKDKRAEEEFDEKFREVVVGLIIAQLKNKLETDDLPTPVFPTSVARGEIPNYYIYEPIETYTLKTKVELFNKLANSICGRCGQRLYGLYIPEEGAEIKEILKDYVPDFNNVNIGRIARVGKINLREIGPFEYVFYLFDGILQEMFRRNIIPDYHVELFVIEGVGGGKKFFSHYIIPNLSEVFEKLYHGDNKYTEKGTSKIKTLISSFLVENWNVDNNLKRNNSEIAHAHINRLLYYMFCHRKLDVDSVLFLEDLKIKLGDTTPIRYLEEVISWM